MEAYQLLEHKYGEFCGNPNTVACSSGTAALHLALETLRVTEDWECSECNGVGQYNEPLSHCAPKEEIPNWVGKYVTRVCGECQGSGVGPNVIIPDFAMIACARSVTLAGMIPTFVDVDNLGVMETQFDIAKHVSVLMAVHTYGRRCGTNYPEVSVVEDLAEAHGIHPDPNSLAACWSFYKNKVIAGEEGGMVAFKTKEQAILARKLRNMGFDLGHSFWHLPRGMNYRLSNCHAELILKSLAKYKENVGKRMVIEGWYNEYCPKEWQLPDREVAWVYDLNLPSEVNLYIAVLRLQERGVPGARTGFKPLSQQEEYRDPGFIHRSSGPIMNPVADRISKTRMYLPIWPGLSKEEVRRSVEELERVVGDLAPA